MDSYEATRIVFSRIQSLDPENASKIMGLLLIQDHGEKEMIRLAFGPEALVHSVVLKARKDLGLSSNITSTTPSSSTLSSSSSSFLYSRHNSTSSSRGMSSFASNPGPNLPPSLITTTTTMGSSSSSSWTPSSSSSSSASDDRISPNSTSYAAAAASTKMVVVSSSSTSSLSSSPFYGCEGGSDVVLVDEFLQHLQDQLSFLNLLDASSSSSSTLGPSCKTTADLFYPQQPEEAVASPNGGSWGTTMEMEMEMEGHHHRRSCSVNDICLGSESGSGYGWKQCLYFARGYCKNGSSCRFLHGYSSPPVVGDAAAAAAAMASSPSKFDRLGVLEQCQELLLRSKTNQQRLVVNSSQLMASASFPYATATAGKSMNFFQQQQNDTTQQRTAAALMLSEEIHKFGRLRLLERNDFSPTTGRGGMVINSGSRQIYLTFPADSTFREEDVSNYFSIYGPVQDVRIPYQQKRMFGFVTFVYSETVKLILAKGNPHFVCDARVLVKPYKEKGKVVPSDKYYRKQQQQHQSKRGDFSSACSTPIGGVDIRDASYDMQHLGSTRMLYDAQEVLLRRKLEEHADLRQALELQGQKLMGLQLLDNVNNKYHHHHHHHSLSTGALVPSPTQTDHLNHTFLLPSERTSSEALEESCANPETTISAASASASERRLHQASNGDDEYIGDDEIGNGKENRPDHEDGNIPDGSVEHNLPHSPFASPTKSAEPTYFAFSTSGDAAAVESERGAAAIAASSSSSSCNGKLMSTTTTTTLLPATSSTTLDVASFKSCFFQMPRFSSGHGAIGM